MRKNGSDKIVVTRTFMRTIIALQVISIICGAIELISKCI